MKYGMTFIIDLYDFEKEAAHHVLTTPGDYIRTKEWAVGNIGGGDENVESLRRNYATAWHALKRRGELREMGLPDALTVEAVDAMADRFSIFVNEVEDDSLPLKGERGR